MIKGKTILITGGTGSFGTTATRYFLAQGAGEIRIFSRDEDKQVRMRRDFDDARLRFHLGDVRDRASVNQAVDGAELVFHAAALKQIPICETHPDQAFLTNVIGSQNVIEAAIERRVASVVCLSTDKAVYPISSLGLTKALMERLVRARARQLEDGSTVLCCVRYGNVLYSRGSVVPLFVEQLLSGQQLTITNPGMTRFLILLEEAIALIEKALGHGRPGDIFILRSPAATVADIAEAVNDLFDGGGNSRVVGTRPGEKIHEVLATREELATAEDFGRGYRLQGIPGSSELVATDYTSENTERLDVVRVKALLQRVPEIRQRLAALGRAT